MLEGRRSSTNEDTAVVLEETLDNLLDKRHIGICVPVLRNSKMGTKTLYNSIIRHRNGSIRTILMACLIILECGGATRRRLKKLLQVTARSSLLQATLQFLKLIQC